MGREGNYLLTFQCFYLFHPQSAPIHLKSKSNEKLKICQHIIVITSATKYLASSKISPG